ncbi:G protein alpha subunit [Apiospora hydei]|uniref:G protein alpha subunit n=1 Tax=Apiospora hydei TaxID=1337664 RepID=A0ABR1V202_9PEZI
MVHQQAKRSHLRQAVRAVRSMTTKIITRRPTPESDGSSSILLTKSNNKRDLDPPKSGRKRVIYRLREARLGQWWRSPQRLKTGISQLVPFSLSGVIPKTTPKPSYRKVLTLGGSESGKSTLHRSMVLAQDGFSVTFRESFTESVWDNFVDGTWSIIHCMQQLQIPCDEQRLNAQEVIRRKDPCLVEAFWNDAGVQRAYHERNKYPLNEGYAHFIRHAERIMSLEYVPSDQDIINTRIKTTGHHKATFKHGGIKYTVTDVGGARSERKKWTRVFPETDVVTFTVDVTSYARVCCEADGGNRMQEQLTLFGSLVNGDWFKDSEFVLVFTKVDLLGEWLRIAPAKRYFHDLEEGPEDTSEERYLAYLERRFFGPCAIGRYTQTRAHRPQQLPGRGHSQSGPRRFKVLDELSNEKGWPDIIITGMLYDEHAGNVLTVGDEEIGGEHSTMSFDSQDLSYDEKDSQALLGTEV